MIVGIINMEKNISKSTMSTEENTTSDKDQETWNAQERESLRSLYGCEILKHNCTLEDAKDKNVPSDAHIVTYLMNGKICYDLTRSSKMVNIFDMYYDTMGNVIRSIEWGYGKINPKNWGYEPPKQKKRK